VTLSGKEWYQQQATRAYNQAIGRVIRHRQDYGNIILLDARFAEPQYKSQVSKWLRDDIQVFNSYKQFHSTTSEFFENIKKLDLKPKVIADISVDQLFNLNEETKEEIEKTDKSSDEELQPDHKPSKHHIEDNDSEDDYKLEPDVKVDTTILKNSGFKRALKQPAAKSITQTTPSYKSPRKTVSPSLTCSETKEPVQVPASQKAHLQS